MTYAGLCVHWHSVLRLFSGLKEAFKWILTAALAKSHQVYCLVGNSRIMLRSKPGIVFSNG